MRGASRSTRRAGLVAVGLSFSLLAAGCGGTKANEDSTKNLEDAQLTAEAGESGLADAGDPQRGGKLVYGVEDAIAQAKVLDAVFRSAKSGKWEKP